MQKGKKKAKSMRSNQMQDVYDSGSSFYDPADSKRYKLRRLYETPGIGH